MIAVKVSMKAIHEPLKRHEQAGFHKTPQAFRRHCLLLRKNLPDTCHLGENA